MKVSVPAHAGGIPPETGASRNSAVGTESLTALSTSSDVLASIVDVSKNSRCASLGQPDKSPVDGS